ncbi:MAG: preprotein translocase subunit YajC [Gemmataceae bacterium]
MAMLDVLIVLAEESTKPAPGGFGPMELPLIMLVIFALLFFIVIRPAQKRQERERLSLLSGLKKNDRVLTTAGIYGTIVSISDKEDEVIVKVDDNTRLKMLKSSIARNLNTDETPKS